ncbi:MAG: response regulator [Planctomycetia bacterium]|nr:response regulator [Planctomycetia bacterium]
MRACEDSAAAGIIGQSQSTDGRPLTVLLIDDDASLCSGIRRKCHASGVKLLEAYNGSHGYRLAVEWMPDVVVTDLRMPMGQGEDVVDGLNHNPDLADIPVIVITGLTDRETHHKVQQLGVARILTKPFAAEDLIRAIHEVLHLPVPA